MNTIYFGRTVRLSLAALAVLAAVFVFGCTPGMSPWTQRAMKSVDMLSTADLMAEADKAWTAKEYPASELYYSNALDRHDLAAPLRTLAQSRLGLSAYHNEHYHQAMTSLEKWANLEINAVSRWDWQQAYLDTANALGRQKRLENHRAWALEQTALPWKTRRNMATWYASYYMGMKDWEQSLSVLDAFYSKAPDQIARADFEHAYRAELENYKDGQLADLSGYVSASNLYRFPYALVSFERSLREADSKKKWGALWRNMQNIASNANLADRGGLIEMLDKLEARYGLPRIGIALALPMTGPYAKVGTRILRGAGVGQWRQSGLGDEVDIRVINTAAPGWVDRLDALPPHFSLIGGPLRVQAFKELLASDKKDSILKKRAFFTFLPGLGDVTEGHDAWRFFTSREDEVRSLVRMAVERLGIHNFAVFYPEEKFGRTMAKTFYQEAAPLGARIRGMEAYPPQKLTAWNQYIAKLLKVPAEFKDNKEAPLPMPDFGAVFIPDGWRQAQNLLPNFFFYESEQLVFLGPGLWSRALDRTKDIEEQYYKLAICPGAWWGGSDGAMALQDALTEEGLGKADFWVALGFDFVRFASHMGTLPSGWDAGDVNARIAKAQQMDFSMAALSWDHDGKARQDLFLFSPTRHGKTVCNVDTIKTRMQKATARRIRRAKAYKAREIAD